MENLAEKWGMRPNRRREEEKCPGSLRQHWLWECPHQEMEFLPCFGFLVFNRKYLAGSGLYFLLVPLPLIIKCLEDF